MLYQWKWHVRSFFKCVYDVTWLHCSVAIMSICHLCVCLMWARREKKESINNFFFPCIDETMRWPTLRSRTQATTMTSMAVRSLPRWRSWCSITLNNRTFCVKGTAMSSNLSIHLTARIPLLRGAYNSRNTHLEKSMQTHILYAGIT